MNHDGLVGCALEGSGAPRRVWSRVVTCSDVTLPFQGHRWPLRDLCAN